MKEFINSLWGKKAGKAAIGILAALFIIGGGVTLYAVSYTHLKGRGKGKESPL